MMPKPEGLKCALSAVHLQEKGKRRKPTATRLNVADEGMPYSRPKNILNSIKIPTFS
jgi:hypothetical protein